MEDADEYAEFVVNLQKEDRKYYNKKNFNPQDHWDKERVTTVLCPQGHCLYPKMKFGTLYKKGVRPSPTQWQSQFGKSRPSMTLSPAQYALVKKCKECK